MFEDREDAGQRLVGRLAQYRGREAIVLAIPRGGVVVGAEVAASLALPLDILCVRKIGHPTNPEYAIGAVDESGAMIPNRKAAIGVDKHWIENETKRQRAEAIRRAALYRGGREAFTIMGKTAIIVDDGIATGLTMQLAVRIVKAQQPAKIVVASPVAPEGSLLTLKRRGADEVILLVPPDRFLGAVSEHYRNFSPVEDDIVIHLMQEAARP